MLPALTEPGVWPYPGRACTTSREAAVRGFLCPKPAAMGAPLHGLGQEASCPLGCPTSLCVGGAARGQLSLLSPKATLHGWLCAAGAGPLVISNGRPMRCSSAAGHWFSRLREQPRQQHLRSRGPCCSHRTPQFSLPKEPGRAGRPQVHLWGPLQGHLYVCCCHLCLYPSSTSRPSTGDPFPQQRAGAVPISGWVSASGTTALRCSRSKSRSRPCSFRRLRLHIQPASKAGVFTSQPSPGCSLCPHFS